VGTILIHGPRHCQRFQGGANGSERKHPPAPSCVWEPNTGPWTSGRQERKDTSIHISRHRRCCKEGLPQDIRFVNAFGTVVRSEILCQLRRQTWGLVPDTTLRLYLCLFCLQCPPIRGTYSGVNFLLRALSIQATRSAVGGPRDDETNNTRDMADARILNRLASVSRWLGGSHPCPARRCTYTGPSPPERHNPIQDLVWRISERYVIRRWSAPQTWPANPLAPTIPPASFPSEQRPLNDQCMLDGDLAY
jgi:hypothetical protein